jgi:hypothetical protein
MPKFDHNIGFLRKTPIFFSRKLSKIKENCEQNIEPWPADKKLCPSG